MTQKSETIEFAEIGAIKREQSHQDKFQKCPNCSEKIALGSLFCEHCGAQLSDSKNRNTKWIISVSVLVLCIIAIGGIAFHQHSLYVSALERLNAIQCDTPVEGSFDQEKPNLIQRSDDQNGENDITKIVQQRDDLLLEVRELQEKTRKLQNKVNELDEENGYLTTDVRLATEALKECMGK